MWEPKLVRGGRQRENDPWGTVVVHVGSNNYGLEQTLIGIPFRRLEGIVEGEGTGTPFYKDSQVSLKALLKLMC